MKRKANTKEMLHNNISSSLKTKEKYSRLLKCCKTEGGNCEEELPKKPVGRQLTDRLPTVSKIENLL